MGQPTLDGLSEGWTASRRRDLAIVLEHLWKFYEAMRSGKPVSDGDERLAQIGVALRNSAGNSESRAAQANESPAVPFGSLPSC